MKTNVLSLVLDNRRALKQGHAAIRQRQQERLRDIVGFAREHSPYYREFYQSLSGEIDDVTRLPVTSKKALMARFNDWSTDREITIEQARAFIENPDLIGERFLGRHTLATTSGTTGTPGIFVIDDATLRVTKALAVRLLGSWLGFGDFLRVIRGGGRMSIVMATGGHFASTVAAAQLRKGSPRRAKRVQVLSARAPVADLVSQLNEFGPALLAPYASVAALLASEQEVGRLNIEPVLLTLSAEGLPQDEYARIAKAFKAKVGNSYAATECPFMSYSCAHGWLHVNSDWVVLEGVGADYQPTPLGEQSHTVLITNLANRVQPILRYDLGDSIVQRPDPCPCGNPLPAIRVQGRSADVLIFEKPQGGKVSIPPLAFEVDDIPGVELGQIVQTAPTKLRVRLQVAPGADAGRVWQSVEAALREILVKHGLDGVQVERADELPERTAGGKYRAVVPLSAAEPGAREPR